MFELAQALIRCRSVTPAEGGALTFLQSVLEPAGFACHRMTMTEPGTPDVENLYARLGTGAPHLCFAGHTDVVPAGDEAAWTRPAVRRRGRRRRALRPRRGRHEGRAGVLPRRRARASEGQRRLAARLAVVPDHGRRGVGCHQRHAEAAGLAEGARRDARCLPGRRAGQQRDGGRPDQDRPARLRQRPAGRARQAGPLGLRRARREPDPEARPHHRPAVLDAARRGQRALPALEPAGHHRLGAEHGHQRHPGLRARQLQHPLQRPAHAGQHRGLGEASTARRRPRRSAPASRYRSRAPATCS